MASRVLFLSLSVVAVHGFSAFYIIVFVSFFLRICAVWFTGFLRVYRGLNDVVPGMKNDSRHFKHLLSSAFLYIS
jgi:hypothetical protein